MYPMFKPSIPCSSVQIFFPVQHTIFQTSLICVRWTWSKYHNKNQQISDATEQNLVSQVAAHVGFVHTTVLPYCTRSSFMTILNTSKITVLHIFTPYIMLFLSHHYARSFLFPCNNKVLLADLQHCSSAYNTADDCSKAQSSATVTWQSVRANHTLFLYFLWTKYHH